MNLPPKTCHTCKWFSIRDGAQYGRCHLNPPQVGAGLPQVGMAAYCSHHEWNEEINFIIFQVEFARGLLPMHLWCDATRDREKDMEEYCKRLGDAKKKAEADLSKWMPGGDRS